MAERTSSTITIDATPAEVMAVIAGFEAYPEWTGEVKETEVLEVDDTIGRAVRVRFKLDAGVISDEHVLGYTWDGDREVRWTLVTSQMLKALDGRYALSQVTGGGTEVTYELTVDVKIPMLGMLKRKAEKVIIDRALTGLKKRVEG
ncbi:SRPBCC family protein [Embleya sp. AB8]|uniref:SRPBCC family protein n=1 Tax=Embleya sp. AB8 TaxID=3156304 RepID=UPI003C711F9B